MDDGPAGRLQAGRNGSGLLRRRREAAEGKGSAQADSPPAAPKAGAQAARSAAALGGRSSLAWPQLELAQGGTAA